MQDKLSVIILLNERKIPFWIYSSIDNLINSSNAYVALIVSRKPLGTFAPGRQRGIGIFILKLIEKIDYLIFRKRNNYNLLKNISDLKGLTGIFNLISDTSDANTVQNRLNNIFLEIQPDLIIKFGVHNLNNILYAIPRYGVWSFSIDSDNILGGFDYGFWEVFRYKTISFSNVEAIIGKEEQSEIVFESIESTCPFSINKNRNNIFYRASLFLTRLTEGLSLYGEEYLLKQIQRHHEEKTTYTDDGISTDAGKVLEDAAKYYVRILKLVINKIRFTDAFNWQIAIDKSTHIDFSSDSFRKFKTLRSPQNLFWADPFVVSENNCYFLFVEEYIYSTNKAHISVIELDPNRNILRHQKVIEKPYHMSYPFVFRERGSYYMIPETASNKTIELYRCTEFPDIWEFDRYIMKNISATDTTLFYYNEKWWLFTTLDQTGGISGGSTELFLFYADSPLADKWVSHPLNPVVSDESSARCAGNLFICNGIIYRPSQDCTIRYGRGFNLQKVTMLTETEYKETNEKKIKPEWKKDLKGAHTYNFINGLTVIDAYTYHRRF
ncbi:MAG: hypothetical protein KA807_07890 [Prolixibacteraceae bacterium]|nr:hypothetical protein [Prolixibacteraceae bacterium]